MDLYPKNRLSIVEVKKFIVIFYIVGIVGLLFPFSKDFFILITPLALIMNSYLLAIYHASYSMKTVIAFVVVFLLGFFVEYVGVRTGLIFGNYYYGGTLGPKLFNTPLLIGVNWLFLTYISMSVAKRIIKKDWFMLVFSPIIMVIYDVVLEQVAPQIDMWYWQASITPIKNYIAWYFIGLCFVSIYRVFRVDTKNPLSILLFMCQFIFFTLLTLFQNIIA